MKAAECYCGRTIWQIKLPDDLAAQHDEDHIWVHDDNDVLCYPEYEDDEARAEPIPEEES